MTSTEISHVALQYCAQFKFCRCSISCEVYFKVILTILNSVNNTNNLMLRHDNDGEADSKITFKGLRAVNIQGPISTLKSAF